MKKRKILLGLALAAAAVFSLSACGDDTTPTTTPTTEGDGGSGTGTGTGTGTGEGQGQTPPATQTFDVKFMNGSTELTALKQTVEKDGKVTKPARASLPTQTGKRFDFWSADGGVTPYNFNDAVTGALTLTAVFDDASDYDTLAASDKKIFATDFYDETVEKVDTSSFDSTTVKITTTDDANSVTNDGQYHIEKNNLNIDFGDKKISTSGILTVYFEVSFDAIKNGEAFFQVDGTSAAKTNSEVFGIRVAGDPIKGKFGYRVDGGADTAAAALSTEAVAVNTIYEFKVVIDTADGKASVYLDGQVAAENVDVNISAIRGIKFTAKGDATSKKNVDNIVATFEAKTADPVVTAKAQALAAINEYKAGTEYTGFNSALKSYVDGKLDDVVTSIGNATTVDAVNTIKTQFTQFVALDKFAVPVKAYTAASTAATGVDDLYVCVIDTVTTATDIETQLNAISFSGYVLKGIYSDAALTTEVVAADAVKNATLYAKVADASVMTFDAATALASYTKGGAVNDGTVFGDFTLKGSSAKRSNSDTFSLQTNKGASSYLEFVVTAGKTASVTLVVSSTGSSDTTSGPFIYLGDNGVADTANTESVTGSQETVTLTYTNLAAGTYKIQTKDTVKGLRIYSVTVNLANANA